jgi:hypothetical protein
VSAASPCERRRESKRALVCTSTNSKQLRGYCISTVSSVFNDEAAGLFIAAGWGHGLVLLSYRRHVCSTELLAGAALAPRQPVRATRKAVRRICRPAGMTASSATTGIPTLVYRAGLASGSIVEYCCFVAVPGRIALLLAHLLFCLTSVNPIEWYYVLTATTYYSGGEPRPKLLYLERHVTCQSSRSYTL